MLVSRHGKTKLGSGKSWRPGWRSCNNFGGYLAERKNWTSRVYLALASLIGVQVGLGMMCLREKIPSSALGKMHHDIVYSIRAIQVRILLKHGSGSLLCFLMISAPFAARGKGSPKKGAKETRGTSDTLPTVARASPLFQMYKSFFGSQTVHILLHHSHLPTGVCWLYQVVGLY